MYLPDVFNAPRLCQLGGRTFFCRALSVEGMAVVLAWLDDRIPGRADRAKPPDVSCPEAQALLAKWEGRLLVSWLATREHGLGYDQVVELALPDPADEKDVERAEIEQLRIADVVFASRRTKAKASGAGGDIAETWCGEGVAQLATEIGLAEVGKLSLDQVDWLMHGGKVDEHAAPPEARVDQQQVAALLDHAKTLELPPEVIEAYERAAGAMTPTGEAP